MPVVGYFTAEIGLWSELHTYSGGLGVLAGDHVKSAADAGIPLVGVTLLYHQGYARQHIDSEGIQTETFPEVDMNSHLTRTDVVLELELDGKPLFVYVWVAEDSWSIRPHGSCVLHGYPTSRKRNRTSRTLITIVWR